MAVAFQSAGTQAYTSSGTSVSPGAPAGVVVGDLLFAAANASGNAGRINDPAGWTLVGSEQGFFFNSAQAKSWYRIADGTANDTPTITRNGTGSLQAGIIRIDGHAATPFDVVVQGEDSSRPITVADATVTEDASLAVAVITSYLADDGDCTGPAGYTQRSINGSGEDVLSILTSDVDSGSNGGGDFTFSSGLRYGYFLVVFSPAAVASDPTLDISPASLNAAGQTVGILARRYLTVDAASIAATGQNVGLSAARNLLVEPAIVSVTGQDVTLTAGSNPSLTVDAASIAATGQDASLTAGRNLTVDAASLSLTGQAVEFTQGETLAVDPASATVAGQNVTLSVTRLLTVAAGQIAITGQSILFDDEVAEALVITGASKYDLPSPSNSYEIPAPSNFIEIEV